MAVVLSLDGLTNAAVTWALGPDSDRTSWDVVPGFIELDYSRNTGIAFGLLSGGSVLVWLAIGAGFLLGAWLLLTTFTAASELTLVAFGLIAGGAVANLVNRLASGYVVDFIDVGPWPSFNVADAMLTIGLLLVIAGQLRGEPGTMAEHRGG